MNFEQDFRVNFGEKYPLLQLKNVVVKKSEGVCTITFLYPSTVKELSESEKKEIIDWIKAQLTFERLSLKVKFMRVFLEEKLILKFIQNFMEEKYKLVTTYLKPEHISIKLTPIDVLISFRLSPRFNDFFVEHKIVNELSKELKNNFLTEFAITLNENVDFVDEVDIENVELKTAYKPIQRYEVEVVKDIIGKGITPKPEYLSFIKTPKKGAIVAGYIKRIERKEFIRKTGKQAGQPKAYYNFQIQDKKGKLDCIYFSSKPNEKVMDALEEFMFVLLHGDVEVSKFNSKLCMKVDRIALASEKQIEEKKNFKKLEGPVVEIEKLTSLEQDTMFEHKDRYNNKIMGKTIVVFDIETTGLDSNTDQIIELGAVKVVNGNVMEKFSSFVKPTIRIPFNVQELTGISNEMVEDAPPIDYVIKDFYEFTRGCVLCGHNVIGFDIKFIKREGDNLGLDFNNEIIDTMNEARVSRLKISRFNLGTVVKALGLTLEGAHRAWNDAYATAQVLLKLNEV